MSYISLIIILIVSAAILIVCISYFVRKRPAAHTNIHLGYFHHNGNLDFYISKDGQFVSRTENRSFDVKDIDQIQVFADNTLVYSKSKDHSELFNASIENLFQTYVGHITYTLIMKNGNTFESVVDVATNKRQTQSLQLKEALYKTANLFEQLEVI